MIRNHINSYIDLGHCHFLLLQSQFWCPTVEKCSLILHKQKQGHDLYRHLDDKRTYFCHVILLHSGGNTVFQESELPGLQILVLIPGFLKNLAQCIFLSMPHG